MVSTRPIDRLVNLLDPEANVLLNMSLEEALARVGSGDPERVRGIDGQFALLWKQGTVVRMARSIGRPMRYFLAKLEDGPCLVVAERIDEIHGYLAQEGLAHQFHPSYTRMVPAHHVTELALVGCPDPNPTHSRFFTPPRNQWGTDLDAIGKAYIGTLANEISGWLDHLPPREPIGLLFSGGIDSGSLLVLLSHLLLRRGEAPTRLKAFTLRVDGGGEDARQAIQFVRELDLEMHLELVDVRSEDLDYREAIRIIEDYKPLDVQAATVTLALCRAIRARYPDWVFLVDGDGGDENLKDYPIEANPELTIRSVLNNSLLYQEGWGVDAVKHSLTYSGGQSRGHVRSYAPARHCGFQGFSPYALPNVIEVAEGTPFIELTDWCHDRLYALKGEIVRRGVEQITGTTMPVFPKRRFQEGAVELARFGDLFPEQAQAYRQVFAALYS